MPTPVTGRCNVHSAATYGQPIGVRCRSCERRVLVPLDKLTAHGSDMTPLHTLPLKCAACGGREVELLAVRETRRGRGVGRGVM